MASRHTDVLSCLLFLVFMLWSVSFNHGETNIEIRHSCYQTENHLVQLLLFGRKYNVANLKIPYLPRKCLLFLLLISCGDIEICPGPIVNDPMVDFTSSRGIKIVHQNVRGLSTNLDKLKYVIEKYKNIDIITLSETHISSKNCCDFKLLSEFQIPGYKFIQKHRKNGPGGGVGMYISNRLTFEEKCISCGDLETIWAEISVTKSKNFLVNTIFIGILE